MHKGVQKGKPLLWFPHLFLVSAFPFSPTKPCTVGQYMKNLKTELLWLKQRWRKEARVGTPYLPSLPPTNPETLQAPENTS